jgi:predicted nucleotidyltransferase
MASERSMTGLDEALTRLVAALRDGYGPELLAVILYGSTAVEDHVPGASDVNLLVMLRAVTPEALRRAKRPLAAWPGEPPLLPLFLSPEELRASTDVFPIELLDMRDRHRVLWGEDPLREVALSDADLRRQLEAELRGKWLRLRQSYLRDTGDAVALRSLLRESLSSFQVLFAAALRLRGEAKPPRRAELFARAWDAFGLDPDVLQRAVAIKEGQEGWPDAEMEMGFERYLECVTQVLKWVEEWRSSGSP